MGHFLQLLFESYTELLILIDESMIFWIKHKISIWLIYL